MCCVIKFSSEICLHMITCLFIACLSPVSMTERHMWPDLGKPTVLSQPVKLLLLLHVINTFIYYSKHSDNITRDSQVCFSTRLFLHRAKHWKASTDGEGPLGVVIGWHVPTSLVAQTAFFLWHWDREKRLPQYKTHIMRFLYVSFVFSCDLWLVWWLVRHMAAARGASGCLFSNWSPVATSLYAPLLIFWV